jgi:LysR family carnitine catabolism transcriptional activator
MNLSGRLIDAFIALQKSGSFTVAAQQCHVTVSALSQMIGRLEEQVGVRLFDRTTRKAVLTPEGEVFAKGAARVSAEMAAVVAELRDRADRSTGHVEIAGPPSLCASWIPQQMALYRQAHPSIALRLHDTYSDDCLAMVASSEVDFGINARVGTTHEIESHLLMQEPMFLLCRKDDSLAAYSKVVLSQLAGRDVSHIVRAGSVWQQMQPVLASVGVTKIVQEVAQLGTLAGLVEWGFGVGIVPLSAVPLCTRKALVTLPIQDVDAVRPMYVIRRRGRTLSIAAQGLWDQLCTAGAAFSS